MTGWDHGVLAPDQSALLTRWLGDPVLVADMSWPDAPTRVLRVRAGGRDLVVKAGGQANHHIRRELRAHEGCTAPLVRTGHVAALRYASTEQGVLVLDFLEGSLADGTPLAMVADVHEQAGAVLRSLHAQERVVDHAYESTANAKALAWLDRDHRIDADVERETRAVLASYRPRPVVVVPTHGDLHPRNWLVHDGTIRLIDFGRFDLRPAATDLCRLAAQQWRDDPRLERAFLRGYGDDPRDAATWPVELLREAVGTAVWAYGVGDGAFEAQGHRMLTEALARF
ncbi:phosphotransferase [Thalassiella azotivora]